MSWRRKGSRKVRTCYVVVSLRERRRKGSVFPKNGERERRPEKAGKKGHGRKNAKTLYVWGESLIYNHSGDNGRKDPPVPIPNTEVKLSRAESTCRDTDREDRSSPLFNNDPSNPRAVIFIPSKTHRREAEGCFAKNHRLCRWRKKEL